MPNIPFDVITKLHENVLATLTDNYFQDANQEVSTNIEHYITRKFSSAQGPLLFVGPVGSGKTSALANVIHNFILKKPVKTVFYHFAGSAAYSECLIDMLRRMCVVLGLQSESDAKLDMDTYSHLLRTYYSSEESSCVVFIDGLDNLDGGDQNTTWFYKLGLNVKLVFSMVAGCNEQNYIQTFHKNHVLVQMKRLNLVSEKDIVKSVLKRAAIELNVDQMLSILSNEIVTPYWLTLACQEIIAVSQDVSLDDEELLKFIDTLPASTDEIISSAFERLDNCNPFVVPLLCLLATSRTGLTRSELEALLEAHAANDSLLEASERCYDVELGDAIKLLDDHLICEGKDELPLNFKHNSLKQAVLRYGDRYEICEWHERLVEYFEHSTNLERRNLEYPEHLLECIEVCYDERMLYVEKMKKYLYSWQVFDLFFHTEHSAQLVKYWGVVGMDVMTSSYARLLHDIESDYTVGEDELSDRYQKFSRFCMQAGAYSTAQRYAESALHMENDEQPARPERAAELNSLLASIWDQKCKLHEWINQDQIAEQRETIRYCRKAIKLRRQMSESPAHELKLGRELAQLAFSLSGLSMIGGDEANQVTADQALREGQDLVTNALNIFAKHQQMGFYAEALMTEGVLDRNPSTNQKRIYDEALTLCRQTFGECSVLGARIHINMGIYYEDTIHDLEAYHEFKRNLEISEKVFGPHHIKCQRARGILNETKYVKIAAKLNEVPPPLPTNYVVPTLFLT